MTFRFDGRWIQAQPDDTIAAALYRQGQRIFSRSFKYHRPRGLLCCAGKCPNCLVNVDGAPNIRSCVTQAVDGMEVRHQNASPSLDFDLLSVAQRFDWMMPVGWYYKTFTSARAWHMAEPWIRRVAGLGEVLPGPEREYEHAWMHADTAVVGGGSSGIAAALAAAARGHRVVLIDDQPELGGRARYQRKAGAGPGEAIARLTQSPGAEILSSAACFGLYEGNLLGVLQSRPHSAVAERLVHLRAQNIVVATGACETPVLFRNNDLPGIMLSSGVQRLYRLHGVLPGRRVAIVGDADRTAALASELSAAGAEIVVQVLSNDVAAAAGTKKVTGIRTAGGAYKCDLIAVCGPMVPDAGLVAQAGGKMSWSDRRGAFVPVQLPPNVSVEGSAAGRGLRPAGSGAGTGKRSFVCVCSDVSADDVCNGIAEGFDNIETLKRYTTATMGPCQGRMCQLSAIRMCAGKTGRSVADTGVTTSRPPNPSVTLGALAGPRHHPVRLTPMHYCHEESGAVWLDMSNWKRPRYYRTSAPGQAEEKCIEAECAAVRSRVGLVDVTTLGKLALHGPDAGKVLDMVYTGVFSQLKPGRTTYAVMCDESGIVLDDGTVSRLDRDRYFITTTTGNVDFVHQQLQWRLIDSGWDVHIANVTSGYGSMNLAGPAARQVLAGLTDCDLSPAGFPYMSSREARVCGSEVLLVRLGFVGELSWEIHCPAESAERLWRALLERGREFSISPFGVEAQRVLRLEKLHVIVGVDTDALSNPYEAGLGWTAKLAKEDFVGKAELTRASGAAARQRLVGFRLVGSIPPDGAAVVREGRSVGRVTSSRYSPAAQATIGMAWVEPQQADEGSTIQVRVSGKLVRATVTNRPFYDPEGLRVRS